MTRRHELERHRRSLNEIREIMNAMKTLAYMETHKLARFLDAQQTVVGNMEAAATDFLAFHGDTLPETGTEVAVYLLIGTERGFCGDINQRLLNQFRIFEQQMPQAITSHLIVIGHKLHLLLENDERVTALINGASVAEEAAAVLQQVINELASLQDRYGGLTFYALYQNGEDGAVLKQLLPPFQNLRHKTVPYSHAPLLNLPATDFLLELTDHYLFAALNEMLYTSLMAENRHRVAHLEGAVQHLDNESTQLMHQTNALRQEEIIEEIEVILLSTDSLT